MPHVAGVADGFGSVQPRSRTMWERAFPFLMAPGPPLSLMAVLFVCVMTALTPLAHASPSDPSWIAGFWDDGDYDDIGILITYRVGAGEPYLLACGLLRQPVGG